MLMQTPETSIGTSIVRKKDTQGIPPLKWENEKGVAQSDLEKAEEFNGQFTDVFNKNYPPMSGVRNDNIHHLQPLTSD